MGQAHPLMGQKEGMEEVGTRGNGPREQGLWREVIMGSQREARKE